jgi:hypothetical protein
LADAGGSGAGEAKSARDGERPHAVGLVQRGERIEGEVEGLVVVALGLVELCDLQEREARGIGRRWRIGRWQGSGWWGRGGQKRRAWQLC